MAGSIGDYIHYNKSRYLKYGITQKTKTAFSPTTIMYRRKQEIFAKLKSLSVNNGQYKELEDLYNDLYFPTSTSVEDSKIYQAAEAALYNNALGIVINEQAQAGQTSGTGIGGAVGRRKVGEVRSVDYNTIEKLRIKLQNYADLLVKSTSKIDQAKATLNKIKDLQVSIDSILTTMSNNGYEQGSKIMRNQNPAFWDETLSPKLRGLNLKLKNIAVTNNINEVTGMLAENVAACADDSIKKGTNSIIDTINKKVQGNNKIRITYNQDKLSQNLLQAAEETIQLPSGDRAKIKLQLGKDSATINQKCDVEIDFNDTKYRLSVKSFTGGYENIHISDELSLWQTLVKNLDESTLNHYLNIVFSRGNSSNKSTGITEAHQLAYVAIATEGLAGISQHSVKAGADANTLLVVNRTAQRVRVINISNLISTTQKPLETLMTFGGYNKVVNQNQQFNKWVTGSPNMLSAYQRIVLLLNQLHAIKLDVRLKQSAIF